MPQIQCLTLESAGNTDILSKEDAWLEKMEMSGVFQPLVDFRDLLNAAPPLVRQTPEWFRFCGIFRGRAEIEGAPFAISGVKFPEEWVSCSQAEVENRLKGVDQTELATASMMMLIGFAEGLAIHNDLGGIKSSEPAMVSEK